MEETEVGPTVSGEVAGALWQHSAKIDGCRLQNPAYSPDRIKKESFPFEGMALF